MANWRVSDYLSLIATIISFIILIVTFFTDIHIFWYIPGACLFIVTILLNIVALFKNQRVLHTCLLIVSIVMLLIFSAPLLLA